MIFIAVGGVVAVIFSRPNGAQLATDLGIITSLAGPAIAVLIAVFKSEETQKVAVVIQQQTNSKLHNLEDQVKALEDELAAKEGPSS